MINYYDINEHYIKEGDVITFTYLNDVHIEQVFKYNEILTIAFYDLNYNDVVMCQTVSLKAVLDYSFNVEVIFND